MAFIWPGPLQFRTAGRRTPRIYWPATIGKAVPPMIFPGAVAKPSTWHSFSIVRRGMRIYEAILGAAVRDLLAFTLVLTFPWYQRRASHFHFSHFTLLWESSMAVCVPSGRTSFVSPFHPRWDSAASRPQVSCLSDSGICRHQRNPWIES
jgi:hypothetical protein